MEHCSRDVEKLYYTRIYGTLKMIKGLHNITVLLFWKLQGTWGELWIYSKWFYVKNN